jgi:chorismate mutase
VQEEMEEIKRLRNQIDTIDHQMMELLKRRFDIARDIGRYKRRHNIPIVDNSREKELLAGLHKLCDELELDVNFVISVWKNILQKSNQIQLNVDSNG